MNISDQQLLRDYAEYQSEAAFAEIVQRHVDLVYSAALRMVGDTHSAKDITQGVFVVLARNAMELSKHPVLTGWLHCTVRNLAAKTIRTDVRRRAREQEAAAMNELLSAEPDAVWSNIAPHLDTALGELSEPDRDALMLRYFERKSAHEIAGILGVSDEAAQKRVNRAVERLRECFAQHGVTVGTSGLVALITANAVQAAPVGLAMTTSTAAALTATTLATTAIAMTTLQKTLITAAIVAIVGTGFYEARQASKLRTLEQKQSSLTEQLKRERDEAAAKLATLAKDNERLKGKTEELARLRAEVSRLSRDNTALSSAKTNITLAAPTTANLESPAAMYARIGAATPEAGLQRLLAASGLGDTNSVFHFLSWQVGDGVPPEIVDGMHVALTRNTITSMKETTTMRIVSQQAERDNVVRARVAALLSDGKTKFFELRLVREGDEWKPAFNITRGSTKSFGARFGLPLTPELGPTDP